MSAPLSPAAPRRSLWVAVRAIGAAAFLVVACSGASSPSPFAAPSLGPTVPTGTATVSPAPSQTPTPAGRIAFVRTTGESSALFVMNGDGSGVASLTSGPSDFSPSWTPDGTKIAFARRVAPAENKHIFVMNADGSGIAQLTSGPGDDGTPAWSPEGTKIAFHREPGGIYVMNADGSGVTSLGGDSDPEWSPDGSKIGFIRFLPGEGTPSDIFVMTADGSHAVQLTNLQTVRTLSWSPDGRRIAFDTSTCCVGGVSSVELAAIQTPNGTINVMNADGSNVIQLTKGPEADTDPVWSPDGTKIAFARSLQGSGGISVMNADGSGAVALTTSSTAVDTEPAWR